jgi:hypothetical protein
MTPRVASGQLDRPAGVTLRTHEGNVHAYHRDAVKSGAEWLIPLCADEDAYPAERHHRDDLVELLDGEWCMPCLYRRAAWS